MNDIEDQIQLMDTYKYNEGTMKLYNSHYFEEKDVVECTLTYIPTGAILTYNLVGLYLQPIQQQIDMRNN